MTFFQAIILGIVQGLTEFVPISSSAHLIFIPWLFGWEEHSLAFDLSLHLGTLVALVAIFTADWIRLIRAGIASIVERKIGNNHDRKLAWFLVIGSVPGGLAGLLAESKIEKIFHQPDTPITSQIMVIVALIIVILGAALFIAERIARHRKSLDHISLKDTLVVGLSQALSVFPGVSRSGSTITGGLAAGLRREDAARFSFLLAVPLVAGAGLKSIFDVYGEVKTGVTVQSDLVLFGVGFLAAVISGYLCIKFLLHFLKNNSTDLFVYYRWLLAAFIIVVVFVRG